MVVGSEEEARIPWKQGKPITFEELFKFYHEYVKVLYAYVQTENVLPQEILFELNAALDHLSRHWVHSEDEQEVVHKAYGHMKRACLDVFKIKFKTAIDQIRDLKACADIKIVDNGRFVEALNRIHSGIKQKARNARQQEGKPDTKLEVPSFTLWEEVLIDCEKIEREFYNNPNVSWAKKRGLFAFCRHHAIGFVLGVGASIVAAFIWDYFHKRL